MIYWLALVIINLIVLIGTREPPKLTIVREKYRKLREHLAQTNDHEFQELTRCIPITAMHRTSGPVGFNTNKGVDIGLCIDGEPNEIFHVLIHELAHCTVNEYSHSDQFWRNFIELRKICIDLGIYDKIETKTKFCGQEIQDK